MSIPSLEMVMKQALLALGILLVVVRPGRPDEGLPSKVLSPLKASTVFIQVKGDVLSGSGSGFVMRSEDDAIFLVTNRHVVAPEKAIEEDYTYIRGGRRFTGKRT